MAPGLVCLFVLSVLVPASAAAADLNPNWWADAFTDASGNYSPFAPIATASGNSVIGYIPTDASQSSPDNDVTNYFRTSTTVAGSNYNGILLGDLSDYTGLTATFSLNDSALAPDAQFNASDVVGETYPGQVGSNAGIRLMFMGGYLADGTPNEWWYDLSPAYVTALANGQAVTLSAIFDPSQWSNYNGTVGSADTAEFYQALAGVTRLGLSLGSGYFFSDGFAFNTGGTADIQVDSISPTLDGVAATPEPATFGLLAAGIAALAVVRRRQTSRS